MANLQKCLGPLLESFVVQELRKQFGWSMRPPMAYHFRTAAGREVDIVLEIPGGKVVGIEVKAAASVGRTDFTGLRELAQAAGDDFVRGVVLYLGENVLPAGQNLWAVPISELWAR